MRRLSIITVLASALLLIACNSMTGVEQRTTGDWDWVLEVAYQVLEDSEYGSNYHVSRFRVENLNREGFFDSEMLFPVWTIYFQNGEDYYLRMRIHPDGDFFLEKRDGWYDPPEDSKSFSYSSEDVRYWITIASYTYHQLFERFDDVSYEVSCRGGNHCDETFVYLLDSDYEELCLILLNSKSGAIIDIRTEWWW